MQVYGITGVKNVTVTAMHTPTEKAQAVNSEGDVVKGKLLQIDKKRIGYDAGLFPLNLGPKACMREL